MMRREKIFIFNLILSLSFTSCSNEKELHLVEGDNLYILDEVSNIIHTYNLETSEFTAHYQYADLNQYRSKDFELTTNGEIYIAIENISGLNNTNLSLLKKLDATTLKETGEIDLDLYPERFALDKENTLYMSHSFEYPDQTGWAISIYGNDQLQEFFSVKGAPLPPTVLKNGNAYFPYFGAGLNHYGESNVLVYNTDSKISHLLFPDGFTYMPPRDLYSDDQDSLYILFNGVEDETPPYYTKPKNNDFLSANKSLLIFNEQNQTFEKIPLDIKGSDMEIVVKDKIAYIYYCDSVGATTSGLYLIDLETKKTLTDYDLGGGTFSEEMLLIDNNIYITNRKKKGIDIFEIPTGELRFIELPEGSTPYDIAYSSG